jgi:hypothetical protein
MRFIDMASRLKIIIVLAFLLIGGVLACSAQVGADGHAVFGNEDDKRPLSFQETMEKLRIEKEKKDYEKLIERGAEVSKIADDLQTAYKSNGKLTEKELSRLATVEKLAKQIRSDLGGEDDADKDDEEPNPTGTVADVLRNLKDTSSALASELKKMTRFTISATAIQSSNAVLRIAKFLKPN